MADMPKIMLKVLMPVMNLLTPTCETVSQKLSESMDHEISLMDRVRVRLHLLGCELCKRYEKQLLAMRKIMENQINTLKNPQSDIKLTDEAREKIKARLRRSDQE